jgi:hypothetical protein
MDSPTMNAILNSSGRKWPKEFEEARIAGGHVTASAYIAAFFHGAERTAAPRSEPEREREDDPRWVPIKSMSDRAVIKEIRSLATPGLLARVRDEDQLDMAKTCEDQYPSGRFPSEASRKLANATLYYLRKLDRGEI